MNHACRWTNLLHLVDNVYTIVLVGSVEFEWDDDNLDHLARHGISADEVEELFAGPILRRRGGTDALDRFRALGRTAAGRYLAIVYQAKPGGVVRAFTGWEMSTTERIVYERQIKV
jgi:uncharacterized protein